MAFFRLRHAIQHTFSFFVGLARRELAINLGRPHFRTPVAFYHFDCLPSILLGLGFHRAHSVCIAAVIGGSVFVLSCCTVIMSATEPMINAAASSVRKVTVSWANNAPSNTATIGFTYAYVATFAGSQWRSSQK